MNKIKTFLVDLFDWSLNAIFTIILVGGGIWTIVNIFFK